MSSFFPSFKFDSVFTPIVYILIPGTIMHGVSEFLEGDFSQYFIRDVVTLVVIIILMLGYKFSIINKKHLIALAIHALVLAIVATFILGWYDLNFRFEPTFLQSQMILSLLMMIRYKEVKNLLIINFILIVFCYFTVGRDYPVDKYIYHAMIVFGAGTVAYIGQTKFSRLAHKMKKANGVIRKQNEELTEMNQSKDQLFRIIGHDLRTPFFQLKSLISMISETEDESEKEELKLLLIESADKGNQLLEDLLKWGNNYQHKSDVPLEKQSLCDIVQKVTDFSEIIRNRKEITLINKISKDVKLLINPVMMETVLRNLIINAIKFSNRGSDIIIGAQEMDDQIRLDVIDEGVGMSEERLNSLFKADRNESTVGTDNEKGSGNGLIISKRLIEKQNGVFRMHSVLNEGTTVQMFFPIG